MPDRVPEVFHAAGQGVLAGASMVFGDLHLHPHKVLYDGPQALTLDRLSRLYAYVQHVRAYCEGLLGSSTSVLSEQRRELR